VWLRRQDSKSAVYHRAMGLFRRRRRNNSGTAAAEFVAEQTETATAQPELPRREVTAEARPNPDQPGWGRALGQQIGRAREDRPTQQ
jgi:hypothetical protein